MSKILTRSFEIRSLGGENDKHRVTGYAATFGERYFIGYDWADNQIHEVVERGAFDGADLSDVVMQFEHTGKPVARTTNNTLLLTVDERGLKIDGNLSKSQAARELAHEIREGLITKMSHGFTVRQSAYDKKTRTIHILKFERIFDVSAVCRPANTATEIESRSAYIEKHIRGADTPRELALLQLKTKFF